jgi:hypothetical protein
MYQRHFRRVSRPLRAAVLGRNIIRGFRELQEEGYPRDHHLLRDARLPAADVERDGQAGPDRDRRAQTTTSISARLRAGSGWRSAPSAPEMIGICARPGIELLHCRRPRAFFTAVAAPTSRHSRAGHHSRTALPSSRATQRRAEQVWSSEIGYPGDPDYREFYQ